MSPNQRFWLGLITAVLGFALAVLVVYRQPDHTEVGIWAFIVSGGGTVFASGGEGIAKNWAGKHEPETDS